MAEYDPQVATRYLPYLGGGPVDDSAQDPPAPLHFRTFRLPANDPDVTAYGRDGVIGWEIKIDDLRGGYLQTGDFARGANELDGDYRMTGHSTLDQRFRRHLILPTLTSRVTRGTGGYRPLTGTHLGTSLFMARSTAAAAPKLWAESGGGALTELTMPAITQVVSALAPIVIGGAAEEERICMMGSDYTMVIDSAGNVDGYMHSFLNPSFGMVTSPINATDPGTGTHLIYGNQGIWALPLTAAIGAAPVQTLSNIPNGGYALGVEKLVHGEQGLRAFWAWPKDDRGAYSVFDGTFQPHPHILMSTNLEGTDPLPVGVPLMWVSWACLYRRNVVAADPTRVILHDGDSNRDLHIFANREAYPGRYQVCGLFVNDNDLFALVAKARKYDGGFSFDYEVWIEQFLPQFDAWVPVSGILPEIGYLVGDDDKPYDALVIPAALCPRFPVSRSTGWAYMAGVGTNYWNQVWMTPSGQNPYYLYQGTEDELNQTRRATEPSGTWYGPHIELPKLEGRWKRADQIVFLGDVDNANADCYVDVALNGDVPTRFAPGQPHIAQLGDTGTTALFTQLQVSITMGRGVFEYKTPNGLPVLIRGRAYLSDPESNVMGLPTGP